MMTTMGLAIAASSDESFMKAMHEDAEAEEDRKRKRKAQRLDSINHKPPSGAKAWYYDKDGSLLYDTEDDSHPPQYFFRCVAISRKRADKKFKKYHDKILQKTV